MGHSPGVLAGAKDGKAVVWGAESFDAFVGLLAVVQARRHAVDGKVGRADESWGGPLGGLDAVMGLDMAVHFSNSVNE